MKNYQNFHLTTDEDGILWLAIDRQGASVNTLSREVFQEFDQILSQIEQDNPKGVILFSAKKHGFVAGADIKQFTQLRTSQEAFELIRQAQLVLNKLASLPVPTVAMIQGFCLGGGLELALACKYRIALDSEDTRIGLPEVKLGIHPGWGGTVRLPNLIGPIEAMKMILPGEAYPARKAAKLGIVDAALPERFLKTAARDFILKQPPPHEPSWLARLANLSFIRPLLGKQMIKQLAAKHVTEAHYPAPYAVIHNWVKLGAQGEDAMVLEAKSIADLMMTDTARNLLRVFFLQDQLKALAKGQDFKPKHIHVVGAGTMGGDIAAWCAFKGFNVTLQDQTPEKIAPAIKRAYQLFEKKLREPRLIQAVMDRLMPDVDGTGVSKADVVIEAIFENLEVKQKLFQSIEPKLKQGALMASNTSSIPLEEIAAVLKNPERLVGIHYFNPVAKMPLVEVVKGAQTAELTVKQALSFVVHLGKLPLPVKSSPGFLVNRVLMPYLMEAMMMYQEGIPPRAIDQAAIDFGMPMGPITLADTVGLDICLSVAENLTKHFGGQVPEHLKQMVAAGHLGVKSGQGFYQYTKNGKQINSEASKKIEYKPDIADRMILRMLNEAVECLYENIVSDADFIDAGMVFGTGFAPFRGGPMHYAQARSVSNVVSQLQQFSKLYGERFKPSVGWDLLSEKKSSRQKASIDDMQ